MKPRTPPPFTWLSRSEQVGLAALLLAAVAFGVLVEVRSAFNEKRKTDLNIYLRAAWAVRAGAAPYDFTTVGESHYNYPPLLAILLVPLADNSEGAGGRTTVPFAVSVALWYLLGLFAVGWSTHQLATTLESASPDPAVRSQPRGCRRWGLLRVVPVLVCLPGIARTLALGQIDVLVMLLICCMIAAALRGRSWWAGFCLAGAICIKLIPAFLLLWPLWRRDTRWLAGCTLGMVLGWGVIPVAALGPARAWDYHQRWAEVVVLPGLGWGGDRSRESDLTGMARVHNQSLVGIVHAFQHPVRYLRPPRPSTFTRAAALLAGAALTVLTLAAARRRGHSGAQVALGLGALTVVMLLVAPVCHPHYFCHLLPLVSGLLALELDRRGGQGVGWGMVLLFAASVAANALTSVPGLEVLRECGVATMAAALMWGVAVQALWSEDRPPRIGPSRGQIPRRSLRLTEVSSCAA